MKRAIAYRSSPDEAPSITMATLALAHDERHLRRKRLALGSGDAVLVDLPDAVALADGDVLVCTDGSEILVRAAPEPLYAISGRDALHLSQLAWHLGNRHLAAQIETGRILILRDHVIKAMVEGLGGAVVEIVEPFTPVRGAYHHGDDARGGDDGRAHHRRHDHAHDHG